MVFGFAFCAPGVGLAILLGTATLLGIGDGLHLGFGASYIVRCTDNGQELQEGGEGHVESSELLVDFGLEVGRQACHDLRD